MAVSDYLKGTGSALDPYIIHNKAAMIEWLTVGCGKRGAFAALATDIDMNGYQSNSRPSWYGSLNGHGHTVHNLTLGGSSAFEGVLEFLSFDNLNATSWRPLGFYSGLMSDIAFIGGVSKDQELFATYDAAVVRRVVSNNPLVMYAESALSANVFALPGAGNMGSKSTDLRQHATPYAASHFTSLNPDAWTVDGLSMPRLIKKNVPSLTQGYLVKGQVKTGGIAKPRFVRALSVADFARINDTLAAADGAFSLPCGFYSDAVMVATYEPYGSLPAINKAYVLGDIIHPATPNGFRYLCTKAGNSGASLPAEPWSTTATLTVGAATFTPDPIYQPQLHGPIKPVLCDLITGLPV